MLAGRECRPRKILAPCNSNVLNILHVSHCGSRFCGDIEELESDKFFESKILRGLVRKNCAGIELYRICFQYFERKILKTIDYFAIFR